MNKNDLIEALTPALGDRARAALAVESLVDVVLREVAAGGAVGITGFGTFEPVDRAPRTGRNPHTGEAVPIPATRTPRFRPGSYFKGVVADPGRLPESGLAGARVGSGEDDVPAQPSRRSATSQGAPATIRRPAGATKGSRSTKDVTPAKAARPAARAKKAAGRGAGTPATVRAERPRSEAAPAAERQREPASARKLTIGGEQITHEMITAKKAQLARAKNDSAADPAGKGPTGERETSADAVDGTDLGGVTRGGLTGRKGQNSKKGRKNKAEDARDGQAQRQGRKGEAEDARGGHPQHHDKKDKRDKKGNKSAKGEKDKKGKKDGKDAPGGKGKKGKKS